LAVFTERLHTIRSIGWLDSDFFNRLGYSPKFVGALMLSLSS
jgi:hypothetical protein